MVVGAEEIALLKNEFVDVFLPLAKQARVVSGRATPQQLLNESLVAARQTPIETEIPLTPKAQALRYIYTLVGLIAVAHREQKLNPAGDDWAEALVKAASLMTHTYGYITAIHHHGLSLSSTGASKRKEQGRRTADKVRLAVRDHRGRASKSQTAGIVSSKVGLTPEVTRRMLSKLYPGELWDESTDS